MHRENIAGDGRRVLFDSRLPRLIRRGLYLLTGTILVFAWLYALWQSTQLHELTLEESKRNLQSVTVSLSQHLDAMINDGVGSAATIVRLADARGTADVLSDPHLDELLRASLSGGGYVQALFVYSHGHYRAVSRNGEPLSAQRPVWLDSIDADRNSRWAGSTLFPDCIAQGADCIVVARRITTRAGDAVWAGAMLGAHSIESLYERWRLQKSVITLLSKQGFLIARVPNPPTYVQRMNAMIAAMPPERRSARWVPPAERMDPVTHAATLYQIRPVHGASLGVAASMRKSDALASWQRQSLIMLGLLIGATAVVALLGWQLHRALLRMEAGESQVHMLLEASPLGILITDGHTIFDANHAAHEILGAPAGTHLSGTPLMNFAPPLQPDGTPSVTVRREALEQLDRHGHAKLVASARRIDTATPVPIEISLSRQRLANVDYVLAIVRDLSELERANEQLAQLNASLEQRVQERTAELQAANADLLVMNRELEAFASSVSHDLRAPLTTISAMAGILREELRAGTTHAAERRLDRIHHAVLRMTEIIEGLLSLAGMTTQSLRWEEVDLGALATQVVQDLRQQHPERTVEFLCSVDVRVRADSRLMRTLLGNLLGNAWKYSSQAMQPRVQFRQHLSAAHGIEYLVADNGAGFDMQQAERLFQPFHRMHSQTEFPGVGLGLAIAQRVVKRYDGHIWAQSTPGHGAAFHFTLPAAHSAEQSSQVRSAG